MLHVVADNLAKNVCCVAINLLEKLDAIMTSFNVIVSSYLLRMLLYLSLFKSLKLDSNSKFIIPIPVLLL